MPAPKHRSTSFRKVQRRVPGGRTVQRYERRKPSRASCGNCGKALAGVPKEKVAVVSNMARTKKRPSRPFGGHLCSSCTRNLLKEKARGSA